MDIGELVMVRLEETGNSRYLIPGLIVNKFVSSRSNKGRQIYEVLTRGKTVCVLDTDLGPIDMFSDKEQLEKKWNDV